MSAPLLAADAAGVTRASDALAAGELVILPTETVYGVAADATNGLAVARIYAAKGRPRFNPLIAHVPDLETAERHGHFSPAARALAIAFWPGPLTLVVPRRAESDISLLATAGLDTIALRAPGHPAAQALLRRFGRPLAAPSANRSGGISPTNAADALAELAGSVAVALDAGPCRIGVESTIVALPAEGPPRLLRPGGIARADIERLTGPLAAATAGEVSAPGMLESHYAPRAQVRLNAVSSEAGEKHLGFGGVVGDLNLSPTGDLGEAAANLFAHLRRLDETGAAAIAVAPIPNAGLGEAINDRLARAAAPRA
jgi:L-threonylcarbamoyladenylate synthase